MMPSVVLVSGGLDSAVALAMTDDPVECLTVDYGQRHRREIEAARSVASYYGVPWRCVTLDPALYEGTTSALLGGSPVPEGHAEAPDATYVPARNTVLLALAAARAEVLGARAVVIGANADDAAAYPDCRAAYIHGFRDVLTAGTVGHVWVAAPLLSMTKAAVIFEAYRLDVPMSLTWSCYEGLDSGPCGQCGACQARSLDT